MRRLLALLALLAAASANAAIPSSQRDALIALHQSTVGQGWTNDEGWLGAPGTECKWFGVRCDEQEANVTDIELYDNNLTGTMPAAIGNLPRLRNLQLYDNEIAGPLPAQIGQLTDLEALYLDRNRLTGKIPSSIGALKNLRVLAIAGNVLDGPLPPEIGDLASLEELLLSNNEITGSLPKELSKLTNLTTLDLGVNKFSGQIPAELGLLRNLRTLELVLNELTGPIPGQLGDLSELTYMRLSYNRTSGPLPPELGGLAKLEHLAIHQAGLTGKLPGTIGGWKTIYHLSLSANQLEGSLPPELFGLTTLESLNLGENQFTGILPREIGSLVNLQQLSLNSNGFTGSLPDELTTLKKLESLDLLNNDFEGLIPSNVDRLSDLIYVDLAGNRFSGPIPAQLGALTRLQTLHLYENELEGSIPSQLGQLTNLEVLTLAANRLSGPIPDALRNLTRLRHLDLNSNDLNGSIPTWIGELQEMYDLELAGNDLTGELPPGLATLEKLAIFGAAENRLTGKLPDFARLGNLAYFDVSSNDLIGSIPASIGALKRIFFANFNNNAFSGPLPKEIGQLASVEYIDFSGNSIDGSIPSEISGLKNAYNISLDVNRLSGTIPKEIGQLTNLQYIGLSFNALRGPVPKEITNLTSLVDGSSHFAFNALFGEDAAVDAFLNRKDETGDYKGTQTITPMNVKITQTTDRSATLQWTPIPFNYGPGGYQVNAHANTTNSAPVAIATTRSKESDTITVRNLNPTTTYLFTVSAVTHPFDVQQNVVASDPSPAQQASTGQRVIAPPEVVITQAPEGMVQIDGKPVLDDSFTLTNFGDVASQISLERGGDFFTVAPESFTINAGASQVVTLKSLPQAEGTYYGHVSIQGPGVVPADDPNAYVVLLSETKPVGTVVAEPLESRVERAGVPGSTEIGQVQFRNAGTAELTGIVLSDQPWVVTRKEPITIAPGQIGTVTFTIDRSKRPEGADGALSASLSLVYVDGSTPALLAAGVLDTDTAGVGVRKVTVVDVTKPPVSTGSIPPLGAGQVAFFIPGVFNRGNAQSDLSIVNAAGIGSINDLKVYFSTETQTSIASLLPLGFSEGVGLVDIVNNVFGATNTAGTLQVRSGDWENISTDAKVTAVTSAGGTLSGGVPVFRGDRGLRQNQRLYLAGVAKPADLVLQEIGGVASNVRIEFYDASGNKSPASFDRAVSANSMVELRDVVPAGAVTVVITNLTASTSILAYARVTDATSGDTWSVVDWSTFYRYDRDDPVRVPFADGRVGGGGKRRAVGHAVTPRAKTDVVLFNPLATDARASLQAISTSGNVTTREVIVGGLDTMVVPDAGAPAGSATAHLVVFPLEGQLAVTARSYTITTGTVGTAIPVLPATAGLRLGQSQIFSGLEDSVAVRTSYGLVETSGVATKVRVRILIDDENELVTATTTRTFDLGPRQQVFLPELVRSFAGDQRDTLFGDLHGLTLEIEVREGSGSVVPFVIVNDTATSDSVLRAQ